MEILTSSIAFAKSIFPATVGSLLAVWRKGKEVDVKEKTTGQKFALVIMMLCAIFVGICIGKWFGGAIIIAAGVEQELYKVLIEFSTSLSGLKIVDSLIKSTDKSLDIIAENIPKIVGNVMSTISDNIDKFLGKK